MSVAPLIGLPYQIVLDTGARECRGNIFFRSSGISVLCGRRREIAPVDYESGAIVPLRDWDDVILEGYSGPNERARPLIAIVSLLDVVRPLWDLGAVSSYSTIESTSSTALSSWSRELLLPEIDRRWGNVGDLQVLGANGNLPNMDTTTMDHRSGLRLGAHLDSWDGEDVPSRERARGRICVNIGRRDRYFLFCDMTASQLTKSCSSAPFVAIASTTTFRDAAAECRPTFFRARIPPGFAYIAPTDLIPHDGSTLGIDGPTMHFTVRGHFQHSQLLWWA